MPSGAKKRKAAAKKKKQKDVLSANNTQGNDHVKTQDEKDSDGGELGSPASQYHENQEHPFDEGKEEAEKKDDPSVETFDAENNSMEHVTGDVHDNQQLGSTDKAVIEIGVLKQQEDFESKDINVEHIESTKELSNGHESSGSSSNSSSSGDKPQVAEEKTFSSVVEAKPVKVSVVKDKIFYLVEESVPVAYLVEPVDSLSKEVSGVSEDAPVYEVYISAPENAPDLSSVKPVVSESKEVIHVTDSAPVENTLVSNVVNPGLKENGEKMVSKLNEVTGAPPATMGSESKKVDDKMLPLADGTIDASCNEAESASKEKAAKPLLSTDSRTTNGVQHIKDSEFPECSANQPLVASAPRAVQKTSWMSCCGLFEALTGSDRY